jgi:hypothetical protein
MLYLAERPLKPVQLLLLLCCCCSCCSERGDVTLLHALLLAHCNARSHSINQQLLLAQNVLWLLLGGLGAGVLMFALCCFFSLALLVLHELCPSS